MSGGKSIDLLPELSEGEIQKVEKKGKVNLFGVFSVLSVVVVTLVVLGLNLLARLDYNSKNQKLADTESEIASLEYIELKQKTLNTKVSTYTAISGHDFSADKILTYLSEVAQGLTTVEALYIDDGMNFEVRGKADSYINVARLWHEMSQQEEYFETVDLEYVRTDPSDKEHDVVFSFSGVMIPDNVDNLE